jgi:hypothetical protein
LRRRRKKKKTVVEEKKKTKSKRRNMSYADDEGANRPKLSLQPRGSAADMSSASPVKTSRPNPFGAARPREQVIAEREGKKETEVLKEQAHKEWKPNLVLTEQQREEKKAAEAELAFSKSELEKEVDPVKSKLLREEVIYMEKKLDELLLSFEVCHFTVIYVRFHGFSMTVLHL